MILKIDSYEERTDVMNAYEKTKGDLLAMIDQVPLSTFEDLSRFERIVQDAIDDGQIEQYKRFPNINQKELKKRMAKNKKEQTEAKKIAQESNGKQLSLADTIKARNEERLQSLISNLEGKAVKEQQQKPKKRSARSMKSVTLSNPTEPTEEEFEAIQQKLFQKKLKKGTDYGNVTESSKGAKKKL